MTLPHRWWLVSAAVVVVAVVSAAAAALAVTRKDGFGSFRECKDSLCGGKGRCAACKGGGWRGAAGPAPQGCYRACRNAGGKARACRGACGGGAASGDCMTRCTSQGGDRTYCNLHCAGRGGDGGGGGPGGRCPDGHYYSTYHHYSGGERDAGLACSDQLRGKIPDDPALWLSADLNRFPCGTWVNLENPRGGSIRMMAVDMRGPEEGKSAFDLSTAGFDRIDSDGSGVRDGHMCLRA
jgi:hypothetical protein